MVQTVAVGTDGSGTADKAVEFAIELAARYDARIVFICAYVPHREPGGAHEHAEAPEDVQWAVNPADEVDATLRDCEQRAEQKGLRWASEARQGDPANILVELAESNEADILVIGNKGMDRRVLGSIPNKVTHTAPCSVMLVKTT